MPKAVLLDLDDTILDDTGLVDDCWRHACESHSSLFAPLEAAAVFAAIKRTSIWFWSDPERHRTGRLELSAARREVARLALAELGITDGPLAAAIGDAYSSRREAGMEPLPEAIDTVRWLRQSGRRLALLTNGGGPAQRKKIARFALTDLFDLILVEGELECGKPDERVYRRALDELAVDARDAWMVGDNLEWDVAAPQKLGIFGVWLDRRERGIPAASAVRPDLIIRSLSELKSLMPARV